MKDYIIAGICLLLVCAFVVACAYIGTYWR